MVKLLQKELLSIVVEQRALKNSRQSSRKKGWCHELQKEFRDSTNRQYASSATLFFLLENESMRGY